MHAKLLQSCLSLCEPVDGLARLLCPRDSPGKSTGVGGHALLQGNLPHPGIEPVSPALAGRFFTSNATWEAPACQVIRTPIAIITAVTKLLLFARY